MAGAPIYLDQRGPFERMMPQMLQMFMQNSMNQRNVQSQREFQKEQTQEGRQYQKGLVEEQRQYQSDLRSKNLGQMPGQINIGGKPFVITRNADGTPKITQVKEPSPKSLTMIELTRKALTGDKKAKSVLDKLHSMKIEEAEALGTAQALGRTSGMDAKATARAIVAGRETLSNVRNTFGVPVQEMVRKEVFELDPKFNFVKPRVTEKAIQGSINQQFKQRGMMGSFVKNLNKQLERTDDMMKDVVSRVGIRAIDLPIRELKTRFKGSGQEKALEAYLLEISNEIGKLSTGSAASIRELSTDAQERWGKIHDPNLSFKQLKIILDETRQMANMRITSTDEEIEETMNLADNLRKKRAKQLGKSTKGTSSRFKILKVE